MQSTSNYKLRNIESHNYSKLHPKRTDIDANTKHCQQSTNKASKAKAGQTVIPKKNSFLFCYSVCLPYLCIQNKTEKDES